MGARHRLVAGELDVAQGVHGPGLDGEDELQGAGALLLARIDLDLVIPLALVVVLDPLRGLEDERLVEPLVAEERQQALLAQLALGDAGDLHGDQRADVDRIAQADGVLCRVDLFDGRVDAGAPARSAASRRRRAPGAGRRGRRASSPGGG